jgi:hypothetical protein
VKKACEERSALSGLEAALHLVDYVDSALAANQAVVAVAATQRFQRVTDLHGRILTVLKAAFDRPKNEKTGFIPAAAMPPGTAGF